MKILVIDDSRTSLVVAESHLKKIQEIDDIILCEDPRKAMDIINDRAVDVILLDIVMPVIDGYDLLRTLRSDHKYDDIPIIMFTQLSGDDTIKRCFDMGASDYVSIPIRPAEFTARIRSAIETRRKTISLNEMLDKMMSQNKAIMEVNKKLEEATFLLISQDKMAAIGQLAAGVAHEINNPLGYVSSNCETIQKYLQRLMEYNTIVDPVIMDGINSTDLDLAFKCAEIQGHKHRLKIPIIINELTDMMCDTHDGLMRVASIVQTLKTFAHAENNDECESYTLDEIIRQVLLITNSEVKLSARVVADIPESIYVFCNKVSIGQVFINIIINAAQAIRSQERPELGTITITASVSDITVIITIEDDGPGIAPEHIDKVFEPFFTTKEVGSGTGLGLSISYEIISNSNGSISAESVLGKGAKFTIRLPLHQSAVIK
jgi:signal transduction histidine kinase